MDKSNVDLDWKKVFKKILGGAEQDTGDNSSYNPDLEHFQRCNLYDGLKLEQEDSYKSNFSQSFLTDSLNNVSDFRQDGGYKSQSFQSIVSIKPTFHESKSNTAQMASDCTTHKSNSLGGDKNVQVPEWNQVFKTILGSSSLVDVSKQQKNNLYDTKKQENLLKPAVSVNTRSVSRKHSYKVHKSKKKSEEEEKANELFALSRLFKLDYHDNINKFEGTGVDVFKCKKSLSRSFKRESSLSTEESDNESSVQKSEVEPFIPLEGFVANFKPYTTADLLASPCIPLLEDPWDEDFLF